MVDVADVAKTVQPEDQNAGAYLSWSKGIQEPKYPSPSAVAFKGAEEAVKQGTSEFNKMFEQEAENRGLKAGEEAVSNYLPAVEAVDQTLFPQDKLDQVKDNLTSSGGPKAPSAVDAGINDIGKATAAYNQGTTPGHIRETMYYGTLLRKAQELRSQWPGYRDYIDKGIEKATGVSPTANHYIKSMLQDINEVLTKKNTNDQFIMHKIYDAAASGVPNMDKVSVLVSSGQMPALDGLRELNKSMATHHAGQVAEDSMHMLNLDKEQRNRVSHDIISQNVPNIVSQSIRTHLTSLGFTPEILADPNKTQELMERLSQNPDNPRAMSQSLTQLEMTLRSQLNTQFSKQGKDGQPSIASSENYKKDMDASFEEFKTYKEAIENQNSGYLHEAANVSKAAEERLNADVWRSNKTEFFKMTHLFNKFGGQGFAGSVLTMSGLDPKSAMQDVKGYIGSASTPGNKLPGLENLKATIGTIMGKNSTNKPSPEQTAKVVGAYIKALPAAIMDTAHVPDAQAIEITKHMFSGANNDWLKEIKGGRHEAYAKMSDPGFIARINKLSEVEPQIGDDYRNWMKRTFADDIFRNDLDYIHTLQQDPGVSYSFYKGDNTHPPRFDVRRDMSTLQTDPAGYQASAVNNFELLQNRVNDFNKGIAAIHNVLGANASDNLYNLFLERGMDTRGSSTQPDLGLLISMKYARKPDPNIKNKNQSTVNP